MRTLISDLRHGLRMLAKNPGFTAVAVLTLALGIGANTAIFSVVNAVLLRPLPYPDPSHLVVMREYQVGGSDMSVNWLNFLDWQEQNRAFDAMAAYTLAHFTLTGVEEATLLRGATVSASLFPLLGVKPALGRAFTEPDDQPGAAPAAILSYELWQRRFRGSPAVVGKTIALNGAAYTVVGVLPSDFADPFSDRPVDLYVPVGLGSGRWTARDERGSLVVIARLRPGVSLLAARSEMETIERRLELQNPKTNRGVRASLTLLYEWRFGDLRPVLLTLLGAVGLVLLIACANVSNLLLARAAARRREFAVRQALGAERRRIVRQLLVESALLGCLGGLLGLLLALWTMGPLVRLAPLGIPRINQTQLDPSVFLFTLAISLLTSLIFGLAPALHSSRPDVMSAIKQSTGAGSSHRWQAWFLVAEVALAMVLVVASGLLVRSLIKAQAVNPGFNPERVLVLELILPSATYNTPAKQLAFYDEAVNRLGHLPGARSAGMVMCPPAVGHCWDWFYTVEDHPMSASNPQALPVSAFNQAGPSYFQTMAVPLLAGRFFTELDDPQSPSVVIVNQTFARLWWPNASPLGKRVRLWSADGKGPYCEIVGVVGDIKEDGLDAAQIPEVFFPLAQRPSAAMTLMMRTQLDPMNLARSASAVIHALDKNLPIERSQPMTQYLSESLARRRFSTLLLGLFAALALGLAAVGTYGVVAYTVAERTREIGVRMALGAKPGAVLRLVVQQGTRLALGGVAIGLVIAWGATRWLASSLFGVKTADLATYLGAAVMLVGCALVACYIPARRAAKVDPMVALRYE